MKNLIILLFFVSFATQAQYTRLQPGDSIYGNKVKFNNIEYTVPANDAFLTAVNDVFWIPAATVSSITHAYTHNADLVVTPLSGNDPSGRSWSDWWSNGTIGPYGYRLLYADLSVRVGNNVIYSVGENGIRSTSFTTTPRFIEHRSNNYFNRDEMSVGDRLYLWRWANHEILWELTR